MAAIGVGWFWPAGRCRPGRRCTSAAIRRDVWPALIAAVAGSCALVAADFVHWFSVPQTYSPTYFLMMSLAGVTGWAWMLTLLGAFMRAGFARRPLC